MRATGDCDFLIDFDNAELVRKMFLATGFKELYLSTEVLQLMGPYGLDFLFAKRPLSLEMLSQAKDIRGDGIRVVSAEGLIGLKIQAYCNDPKRVFQDKADIQSLIIKVKHLDWNAIKNTADLFGEWPAIKAIRDGLNA